MTSGATQSIHERIRLDLERRILSGEWRPGHRVPSEHELMATYGCARMTVSRALTQMAASGLIERRRKAGSFVRQAQASSAVLELPDVGQEVRQLGEAYRFELRARVRRRSLRLDRERLGTPEAGPVLWLECLHLAGPRPYAYETRLINLDVVPAAAAASFDELAPGEWLRHHVPWHSAEHRIRAVNADESLAASLDLQPGHACLLTQRCTWGSDGRPVTWALLASACESRELVARFSPQRPWAAPPPPSAPR